MKTSSQKESRSLPPTPKGCYLVNAIPKDAKLIRYFSKMFDLPEWIISGALVDLASQIIRPAAPEKSPAMRFFGRDTASCLWQIINRQPEQYTEKVPVFLSKKDGLLEESTSDAKAMNRKLEDWAGSLIQLGSDAVTAGGKPGHDSFRTEFKMMGESLAWKYHREHVAN